MPTNMLQAILTEQLLMLMLIMLEEEAMTCSLLLPLLPMVS